MATREEVFVDIIYREKNSAAVAKSFKDLAAQGLTFEKAVTKGNKATADFSQNIGGGLKQVQTWGKGAAGQLELLGTRIEDVRQKFNFNNLTLLFAGMVVQRTAETIAKSTMDTFMKISQGSSEAGRALMQFSAEWTYLKFEIGRAIGEALQPLLPLLIPIMRTMAEFAQRNPTAVFTAVFGAIALGLAAMTVAQVGMVVDMFKGMGDAAGKNYSGATNFIDKLSNFTGGAIGLSFVFSGIEEFAQGNELQGAIETALGGTFLVGANAKSAGLRNQTGYIALGLIALKFVTDDDLTLGERVQTYLATAFAGYVVGKRKGAIISLSAALVFDFALKPLSGLKEWVKAATDKELISAGGVPLYSPEAFVPPLVQASPPKKSFLQKLTGFGTSPTPTTSSAFGGGQAMVVDNSNSNNNITYNVNVTQPITSQDLDRMDEQVKRKTGSGSSKSKSLATKKLSAYANSRDSKNARALRAMGY